MESIAQIKRGKKMYEGKVTYEEGDLLEVVFSETPDIPVGEPITCMITRNYEELHNLEGVVLARDENRLIVFHSPSVIEYKEQRRKYPRFEVDLNGWIRLPQNNEGKLPFVDPTIKVINLSLRGLAFRCDQRLEVRSQIPFYLELQRQGREESSINATLEIVHMKQEGSSYIHGGKIIEINSQNFLVLRKHLLQRQLEQLQLKNRTVF